MVELVRKWCFCKHASENRLTNKQTLEAPPFLPARPVCWAAASSGYTTWQQLQS